MLDTHPWRAERPARDAALREEHPWAPAIHENARLQGRAQLLGVIHSLDKYQTPPEIRRRLVQTRENRGLKVPEVALDFGGARARREDNMSANGISQKWSRPGMPPDSGGILWGCPLLGGAICPHVVPVVALDFDGARARREVAHRLDVRPLPRVHLC